MDDEREQSSRQSSWPAERIVGLVIVVLILSALIGFVQFAGKLERKLNAPDPFAGSTTGPAIGGY